MSVKTILIDSTIAGTISITNTSFYDILMLAESAGTLTGGRVITSFGGSDGAGLDEGLESFGLSLGKNNVTLSIGGNYSDNGDGVTSVANLRWNGEWYSDYPVSYAGVMSRDYPQGRRGRFSWLYLTRSAKAGYEGVHRLVYFQLDLEFG